MANTKELLEELTDLMAHADVLALQEQTLIDEVIPEEVKAKVAEIKMEFADQREALQAQIQAKKDETTVLVLEGGATASGGALQAIYQPGRASWDGKMLDGLMILIPELAQARKVGKSFVQFKMTGGKDG